ncbi:MAG: ankyrin repeat domain-containing protein [Clostridiales bacterium]|nr:ankyrin repeat domain-containing protein [Clostridiales bacterium]
MKIDIFEMSRHTKKLIYALGKDEISKVIDIQKENMGLTKLHIACLLRDFNWATNIIKVYGAKTLEEKDNYGNTPLHIACLYKSFNLINFMLKEGGLAILNVKNKDRNTPVDMLDKRDFGRLTDCLLSCIEICDDVKKGEYLLYWAFKFDQREIFLELLDKGYKTAKLNQIYMFRKACQNSDIEVINKLKKSGVRVNMRDLSENPVIYLRYKDKEVEAVPCDPQSTNNKQLGGNICKDSYIIKEVSVDDLSDKYKANDLSNIGNDKEAYANGNNALHIAIYNKNIYFATELLKSEEDIDAKNKFGHTPLFIAVMKNELNFAKTLIDMGADLDVADEYGRNIVHMACENGEFEFVNWIIEKKANIFSKIAKENAGYFDRRETALHFACRGGNLDLVKLLVEKYKFDVNAKSSSGYMPIAYAKDEGIIRYLVGRGARIDAYSIHGDTPLHTAYKNKNFELIDFLLNNKADINWPGGEEFKTVLEQACINNDIFAVRKFLERGALANVTYKRRNVIYPLHIAVLNKRKDIAALLIKHGANIDAVYRKVTALALACEENDIDMVKLLVENGARVSAIRDQKSSTISPLLSAYVSRSKEIAVLLINNGASIAQGELEEISKDFLKSLLRKVEPSGGMGIAYYLDGANGVYNYLVRYFNYQSLKMELTRYIRQHDRTIELKTPDHLQKIVQQIKRVENDLNKVKESTEYIKLTLKIRSLRESFCFFDKQMERLLIYKRSTPQKRKELANNMELIKYEHNKLVRAIKLIDIYLKDITVCLNLYDNVYNNKKISRKRERVESVEMTLQNKGIDK